MIGSGFGQNGMQVTSTNGSCYQSGMVKWNSSNQRFEVVGFNNDTTPINPGMVTVTMDQNIYTWIKRKMKEEEEALSHPMLEDLYKQYETARILIMSKPQGTNEATSVGASP